MAVPRILQQLSQFSPLIVNDPANRAWALSNFVRVAHPFVGVIIPDDWEWLTDLARHEIQAANNGVVPEPFEDDEKDLVKEALDSIINAIGLWFQHRSQEPHPGRIARGAGRRKKMTAKQIALFQRLLREML